jgi:hypothetical protein
MAELRYLTIPKSVDVVVNSEPWSFVKSACYVVDGHRSFNETGTGVRAGARIIDKLQGRKEGDVVTFDEADWKLLNEAFETPAASYVPVLEVDGPKGQKIPWVVSPRTFIPYLDAVTDQATKKLPDTHVVTNGVVLPLPEAAKA